MIKLNGILMEDGKFPNNECWIKTNAINTNLTNNFIELFYENDSDLLKLYMLKKELDTYNQSCILSIKYMPYSRMDRKVCEYLYSLQYVAQFINELKFSYVEIFDAHSPKTLELIDNSVWRSYIPNLMSLLEPINKEKTGILIPDNGAKRYLNYIDFPHIFYAEKKRNLETGEIIDYKIVGSNSDDDSYKDMERIIIIDDLCSYGGTFIRASEMLRQYRVKKVELVVAHSENAMFKGKLFTTNLINRIYTTNSIPKDKILMEENKLFTYGKLAIYEV